MDRRNFIRRSFGAGALLAAGQLATEKSTVSAAASATGFRIGQVIPKLRGLDQYDRPTSLPDNAGRWTLLDVCPWWCEPCRRSAVGHAAFSAYMNEQSIPFHVPSIVVEDMTGRAANREDAERWATAFGLERDIVMHCAGDATSPLRQIVPQLWQANPPPYGQGAGYPTYALLDPANVVRYYQPGPGPNALQSALAGLTGVALTREWPELSSYDVRGLGPRAPVLPAHVTGVRSDGQPIDETVDETGVGQFGSFTEDIVIAGFGFDVGTLGFGLDSPLSIHFMPAAPPGGAVYRLVTLPEVLLGPEVPFPGPYPADWVAGSAQLTPWSDGSMELVVEPFRSYLPPDPDTVPWRYLGHSVYYERVAPYGASMQLEADVAAATLPGTVVSDVRTLLKAVRDKLGQRNFAAAADKAAKAAAELEHAGADLTLRLNARSLANVNGSTNASIASAAATLPRLARLPGSKHLA